MSDRRLSAYVDSLGAAILLLTLGPLFLLVGGAIAWESPGPILARRSVTDDHGERLELLVFRTTCPSDGARLTGVGKVLRFTCLEQLPALWNVVKGDIRLARAARGC